MQSKEIGAHISKLYVAYNDNSTSKTDEEKVANFCKALDDLNREVSMRVLENENAEIEADLEQKEKTLQLSNEDGKMPLNQVVLIENLNEYLDENIKAIQKTLRVLEELNPIFSDFSKEMDALDLEKTQANIKEVYSLSEQRIADVKKDYESIKYDYQGVLKDIRESQKFMESAANRIREEVSEMIRKEGIKQILVYGGTIVSFINMICWILSFILS